jgi:hypothetical protein
MGYDLKIGEAIIDSDESGYVGVRTIGKALPDAPAYGEPTDGTSSRWPSYGGWAATMRALRLTEVMFTEGDRCEFEWQDDYFQPLINRHPGATRIVPAHAEAVEAALLAYRAAHPTHEARLPKPKPGAVAIVGQHIYRQEDLIDDPTADVNLCRGDWLLYWLKWALANCTCPVFVNR